MHGSFADVGLGLNWNQTSKSPRCRYRGGAAKGLLQPTAAVCAGDESDSVSIDFKRRPFN